VAKLPGPPPAGALAARLPAEIKVLPRGTVLWRIYPRAGAHPGGWSTFRHFGPIPTMRFDHHLLPPRTQARGILYAAMRIYTCLAEVFQETRTIERSRNRPWLVGLALARAVPLLDITRAWPTRAGASMAMSTGRRDRARSWSRRIYEDYPAPEGLFYPSSMDGNQPAVALYERARAALPQRPTFHRALTDPALRAAVVKSALLFNYGVEE
jgi:RES domain-containing protein